MKMTVKNLIEELNKYDLDTEVYLYENEEYFILDGVGVDFAGDIILKIGSST